jgi:hypothetical protein
MNKRITDIRIDMNQYGIIDVAIKRRHKAIHGYWTRFYRGASACYLARVQALQLALFRRNQEQQ